MKLPQIHVRDFFWLALVVAMGVAWWMDRRSLHRKVDLISENIRYHAQRNDLSMSEYELGVEIGVLPKR